MPTTGFRNAWSYWPDREELHAVFFKHLSNVRKFRAGWTLAEICSANRHGSLSETETYLKELLTDFF